MKNIKDYEVVVGIDFGSSGTGFAYSFFDPNDVVVGEIPGASVNNKVPTEIILDDNNYTIQFGCECENHLKEKGLEAGHYFKGIKMNLYENKDIIEANNSGKKVPLKIVIQKVLEEIKKLAIKQISQNRPGFNDKKIKWVVTVPAIWDDRQKSIMMESCVMAGLVDQNTDKSLFFALEPEAASLYCSRDKVIEQKYFQKGNYYIVCDLGGGTGDIVAHLVGSNHRLAEISPSCGGSYGSNEIDKLIFKEIIHQLFGCKDFNSYYNKYKTKNAINIDLFDDKAQLYTDWIEFERKIKDFKEATKKEKISKNEKMTIDCSLFKDIFDKDVDVNDLVKEYNDNMSYESLKLSVRKGKKWLIEFPYKIIYNYMVAQAESICNIINDISRKEKINALIFVGGYSSSDIITNLIETGLSNIKTILRPSNPSLAIMIGAVLFGISPSNIEIRKAKYTIGSNINESCKNGNNIIDVNTYYDKEQKKWFYKDFFDKYIEAGQEIKFGEIISHDLIMVDKRFLELSFFKTKNKNPKFTTDEGVSYIGKLVLDIGKDYGEMKDRKVTLNMKFGGTFIDVTATHSKSNNSENSTFKFD